MDKTDNAIEIIYRKLTAEINVEYIKLYSSFPNKKLCIIFSTLHAQMIFCFERMNLRLPTGDDGNYYWAADSRKLIKCIDITLQLQESLNKTSLAFKVEKEYYSLLLKCRKFLCPSGGSTLPSHMDKIELYYTIPIFISNNSTPIEVDKPRIKSIDRPYIDSVASRALEDIDNGHYDSALTKCRTLIEETFCYVIELQGQEPSDSGDISKLYSQVKELYHMHQDKAVDKRINMLLSGLEKILTSIVQMRNVGSDSHGVGQRRFNIAEHHARLFANSAITMSEFILSVGNLARQKGMSLASKGK